MSNNLEKKLNDTTEYSEKIFRNINFIGKKLNESVFNNCTFEHCDFSEAEIYLCRFDKCKFKSCTINVSKFTKTKLIDSEFVNSRLTGINWSLCDASMGFRIKCVECDLSYSTFAHMDLSNSIFTSCKMMEMEFSDAILKHVTFKKSDLLNTYFLRNDLSDADFCESVNYIFDLRQNKVKKAKFMVPEVLNLFIPFEISLEQ